MNILLWVLQILAALVYGASGVMKVFMFDKVSEGVPSFGALPRGAWTALGILELLCTVGLIVPAGVEVCVRSKGEHAVAILINHTTSEQRIALANPATDLLATGNPSVSSVDLPKYGVSVLELAK